MSQVVLPPGDQEGVPQLQSELLRASQVTVLAESSGKSERQPVVSPAVMRTVAQLSGNQVGAEAARIRLESAVALSKCRLSQLPPHHNLWSFPAVLIPKPRVGIGGVTL